MTRSVQLFRAVLQLLYSLHPCFIIAITYTTTAGITVKVLVDLFQGYAGDQLAQRKRIKRHVSLNILFTLSFVFRCQFEGSSVYRTHIESSSKYRTQVGRTTTASDVSPDKFWVVFNVTANLVVAVSPKRWITLDIRLGWRRKAEVTNWNAAAKTWQDPDYLVWPHIYREYIGLQ
jgi:hypothetical protein